MLGAVAADPFWIDAGFAVAGQLRHRLQRFGRRRQNLDRAAPVVAQLGTGVADADELRLAEHAGRAEGDLEVELAANGQHHIGVAHDRAARGGNDAGVIIGHNAARFASIEIGRAKTVKKADQLRPGLLRAAPADHQRSFSGPQQVYCRLDLIGRGHQHDARLGTEMLLHLDGLRHKCAQRVSGEFDEHSESGDESPHSIGRGRRLKPLRFDQTAVKDVSPLLDLPILEAAMVPRGATNLEVLRHHPTLKYLGWEDDWDTPNNRPKLTTAEFWTRYDAQQKAGAK